MKEIILKTSNEYSDFLNCDIKTKLDPVNKSIDDMLARLDEFQTMICFARAEQSNSSEMMNILLNSNRDLLELFKRIDATEKLMNNIKDNLYSLESKIEKAEEEFGCTEPKVTNLFTPLFVHKKSVEKKPPAASQRVEKLFKTEDYFQ